jgi:hypothetical protein
VARWKSGKLGPCELRASPAQRRDHGSCAELYWYSRIQRDDDGRSAQVSGGCRYCERCSTICSCFQRADSGLQCLSQLDGTGFCSYPNSERAAALREPIVPAAESEIRILATAPPTKGAQEAGQCPGQSGVASDPSQRQQNRNFDRRQANSAGPLSVNFRYVPLPCRHSQPSAMARGLNRRPPVQRAQNRIWPPVDLLAARDQLSMCFTVEIGHLPSCPLIAMRSPCSSSRKS